MKTHYLVFFIGIYNAVIHFKAEIIYLYEGGAPKKTYKGREHSKRLDSNISGWSEAAVLGSRIFGFAESTVD